jgi:hypothetical protein
MDSLNVFDFNSKEFLHLKMHVVSFILSKMDNIIIFCYIYLHNILGGCPFHPSKFLILEEKDDGRGGGGR